MINKHRYCKTTALAKVSRISVAIENLRDMKRDMCPALNNIDLEFLIFLSVNINEFRRRIKNEPRNS